MEQNKSLHRQYAIVDTLNVPNIFQFQVLRFQIFPRRTWSMIIHWLETRMHQIFSNRKCSSKKGPKVHFRFSAKRYLSPKQEVMMAQAKTADSAGQSESQHVCDVVVLQDPRIAICKMCNEEILRGGGEKYAQSRVCEQMIH